MNSELAVLRVAEHLWNRGAQLRNADSTKKGDSVPDIYAETGSGSLSIEVYRPRDWLGLEYLRKELRSRVKNVDQPIDFRACLKIESARGWFDPWAFSEHYAESSQRTKASDRIMARFEELLPRIRDFDFSIADPALDGVSFRIRCGDIRTEGQLHTRDVVPEWPTLTGYAPEPMFKHLIERRILPKIMKNQHGDGETATLHCRLLFVSIEALGYQQEFEFSWYRSQFVDSVRESFARRDAARQRVDAVAFGSSHPFSIAFLCCLTPKAEQAISWLSPRDESQIIEIE